MLTFIRKFVQDARRYDRTRLFTFLEIFVLIAWAAWFGRGMLDFDENYVPWGREFGMVVSTHHFWTFFETCGSCALWDGSQIGGFPALANTYAAILHPLTMITTLGWGVVNGSKLLVVFSLIAAGIAQWWLARELNLGFLARIWGSLMVVVGGHLTGKLDMGLVDLILSTALSSLVFPAVLFLARRQDWHATIILALVGASSILAGQGYIQIFLLVTFPALVFLLVGGDGKLSPLWRKYAAAVGLAALIASVFLVPLLLNLGNIHKDLNFTFDTVQPVKYSLLNFVVDDLGYYTTEILGKEAIPSLYMNFIGWTTILLAIFGVGASRAHDRAKVLYLACTAAIIIGFMDVNFLQWVARWIPSIMSVRYPTFALGIAIPAIVGLASYGIDRILDWTQWPVLALGFGQQGRIRTFSVSLGLIVLIPLFINLQQAYRFGHGSLKLEPIAPGTLEKLGDMKTDSLQWVAPVFGEHFWKEPAVRLGLKIAGHSLPFWTGEKRYPTPYYELTLAPIENPDSAIAEVKRYDREILYMNREAEYAIAIDPAGKITPCSATGVGGNIEVTCFSPSAGKVIVHETWWAGWKVWTDGKRAILRNSDGWLSADAPAGEHTFRFRYQPWEVPVGLFLTVVGIVLCVWLWWSHRSSSKSPVQLELPQDNP